jgi:hypothetical protein
MWSFSMFFESSMSFNFLCFVRSPVRNSERPGTVNGMKRLGTFESERSNALKRIVENVHGTFTVRSRYVHVHVSKTKESLYDLLLILF